ncbi:MAG: sulfotransferase family 2 domain-containing protein [Pseudomonadota bacterium]
MNVREARALVCVHLGIAKWLFIHIPKNAGVSIAKTPELANKLVRPEASFHISRAYTQALRETMAAAGEHHGIQHARWRDVKPWVRDRLQPVAIVRNPWARTVSRFRFAQTALETGKNRGFSVPDTLEAFLEERHEYGSRDFYWHRAVRGWYPQVDYVTDTNGTLKADILRQETLSEEAPRYFGLNRAPRPRNVSQGTRSSYQDFYTPKTIQIVADWYAADIDFFGFDFDSAATRNFTAIS